MAGISSALLTVYGLMQQYGMIKFRDNTVVYCISIRLLTDRKQSVDWAELSGDLDKLAGSDAWCFLGASPKACEVIVHGMPLLVSCILCTQEALHLLKWHDLASEELRVLDEKMVNSEGRELLGQTLKDFELCALNSVCASVR